jgi:hypothetical protein
MTKKLPIICFATALSLFAQNKASQRVTESTAVLKTIFDKHEIAKEVVDKAVCVLVYPSVKEGRCRHRRDVRTRSDYVS